MAGDTLNVNGNLYGHGSHIVKVNGDRFFGFTGIGWDQSRERAYGWGMNRAQAPIGRTAGKYTPGAIKITMWKHSAVALRKLLALLAEDLTSYGNVEVPIFVQYVEGAKVTTVEFERATVVKETVSDEESAEGNKEEWEFSVMKIITDGLTLFDATEGA